MPKLSLFGISNAGKTCFMCAMSQVFSEGIDDNNIFCSLKAVDTAQQVRLNNKYLEIINGKWPDKTAKTEEYSFNMNLRYKDQGKSLISEPFIIHDFKGGILNSAADDDQKTYKELIEKAGKSAALMFIVDGKTLFNVLNPNDWHVSHRHRNISTSDVVWSKQQIGLIENMISDYRKRHKYIPPVIVAISKADTLTPDEMSKGKEYIRRVLPSVFGKNNGAYGVLTHFSLGKDLENGLNNARLFINSKSNIHIPVLFTAYCVLSEYYYNAESPKIKKLLADFMMSLAETFDGRIEVYKNGSPTIKI